MTRHELPSWLDLGWFIPAVVLNAIYFPAVVLDAIYFPAVVSQRHLFPVCPPLLARLLRPWSFSSVCVCVCVSVCVSFCGRVFSWFALRTRQDSSIGAQSSVPPADGLLSQGARSGTMPGACARLRLRLQTLCRRGGAMAEISTVISTVEVPR